MGITVNRNVSGSYVVVTFPPNPWRPHDCAYVDARKDVRYPNHSFIEAVNGGQVWHKECVHNAIAPDRIMEIVRYLLKGESWNSKPR